MTERRPRAWQLLAVVVSVPIALAAARGVRRGYLPIGDNALIEIRARDVMTAHHPWLGTWSSASISSSVDVNHPGPLLFDVLALPVRVLGAGPGVAFGVAALQIGVVWAIAWSAQRFGGRAVMTVVMAATAWFAWSIGSELLYDPWQPNLLMLPFLLVLVLVWGTVAGHDGMLPWAVLVASFCVQTHLSYVFLAPAMVLLGAIAVGHRRRRDAWRPIGLAAGVGVLAWSQPILEQLFGSGQGNLSRLAASGAGGEATRTGFDLGVRLVAGVVALPPWWTRPGMMDTIPVTQWSDGPDGPEIVVPGLAGLVLSVVALVALLGLVVVVLVRAIPRTDRVVASGAVVVLVALALATVTTVITPIDRLGVSPHKLRWLWPIAVVTTVVLVVGLGRELLDRMAVVRGTDQAADLIARARRRVPVAASALVVVGALATVPFHAHDAGPVGFRGDIPRIRGLVDQLDVLRGRGVVLFDASGLRFAEPFTAPTKAGLQRAGVPFVVDEEGLVRQMGERRRFTGDADLRVYVRDAEEALVIQPGVERVAFQPGLTPVEREELDGLEGRLASWMRETDPGVIGVPDDATLFDLGPLAAAGSIDLTPALGVDTGRYVDLDARWRGLGLAVFAEPLP